MLDRAQYPSQCKAKLLNMNLKVALIVLVTVASASAVEFHCQYQVMYFSVIGQSYTCRASLSNAESSRNLTTVRGTHLPGRSNADVALVLIIDPNLDFVPQEVTGFFANLFI
jgi:hypothetical protein